MGRLDRELSLKGGPTWRGIGDASIFSPTEGMWKTLRNCYVSRDGTELRRMMGCARTARPYYADKAETIAADSGGFGISAMAIGADPILDLDSNHYLNNQANIHLARVEGNGEIADGWYNATRTDLDSVQILGVTTSANDTTGKVYFTRVLPTVAFQPQVLSWAADSPCVVMETVTYDAANGTTPYHHFATWVGDAPLEWDSYSGSSAPEEIFRLWFSPVNQEFAAVTGWPGPTLMTLPPNGKPMSDVANDNLNIVMPGHGAAYRACTSSKKVDKVSLVSFMGLLGVPQGRITTTAGSETLATTGGFLTDNTAYILAIGYRNTFTGELGIPSDARSVTTGAAGTADNNTITVAVETPRGMVAEGGEYNYVLYMSAGGATSSASMRIVEEQTATNIIGTANITWTTSAQQESRLPVLEVPPMGGSCIKTVRGVTFIAGLYGSRINDTNVDVEEVSISVGAIDDAFFDMDDGASPTTEIGRMFHLNQLSSSVAGMEVFQGSGATESRVRLDAVANGARQRWTILTKADASGQQSLHMILPRGHIWFSELGNPGVFPAINRVIVDRIRGRDINSFGRIGDSLLIFTEKETYRLSWGRSPLGQDPVLISDAYGCVSPNSVVETEGFVAWLSEYGPCISSGGSVQFIGSPILDLWQDLKRDSRGLLLHCVGVADPSRKTIMWGVRTDWHTSRYGGAGFALDEGKATIHCDEFIVWNYATNSFSTARYSGDVGTAAIGRLPHVDGIDRTAFVSSLVDWTGAAGSVARHFHDIYSMEDNFVDHRESPLESTATVAHASGGTTFIGGADDFTGVRVGEQAFVRTGDDTLEWYGTVGAVSTTTGTDDTIVIDTPGTSTWAIGAVIVIGVIHMEMTTNRMRFSEIGKKGKIHSLTFLADIVGGLSVSTEHAWVDVSVTDEDGTATNLFDEDIGKKLNTHVTKLSGGGIQSNTFQFNITVISDSSVRIKDIIVERGDA